MTEDTKGERNMIQGTHLVKRFDDICALDDTSFHVPEGSVYGLLGPNGAGKSTLLRHVMGILKPDAGELLVDGQPVFENAQLKEEMAFIPDEIFYMKQASVMNMKDFYKGIYHRFDDVYFDWIKGFFSNLDLRKPIQSMSKGMKKQSAFLLAMCMRPKVLVLDEPIDGLDPVMRRQVWQVLLAEVDKHKMTVLVSSHNLRELEDVCDHVGFMHHGKVILENSVSDLQSSVTKLQLAFNEEIPDYRKNFRILHESSIGRVKTLIIRGQAEEVLAKAKTLNPVVADIIPLSLEEIFIYELEGLDYEIKNIII